MKDKISIFGSTGSIGESVFKIYDKYKKNFEFYILTGNENYKEIINQIKTYKPKIFIIFNYWVYLKVKKKINNKSITILHGNNYQNYNFKKSDVSISAIPGIEGLQPTLFQIKISKKILIANKESVICGWELISRLAKKNKTKIIPIDSEHFSIMRLIENTKKNNIDKIYLTASGGPFLNFSQKKMKKISPAQATKHPKWKMGKKISVDSATMMNKIFEVIEAHKLFSIDLNKIQIVIHPQSLVHAIIKYKNGLQKFLYFDTDMTIPIANTLVGDNFEISKLKIIKKRKSLSSQLNFLEVDNKKFPAIKLKPILNKYVSMPIVLNAANEIFVDQFLKKNISFFSIINYLFKLLKDQNLRKYAIKKPSNLKSILTIDKWTRERAMRIINNKK